MATPTFTKTGSKSATAATLPKSVFLRDVSHHELLKQVYLAEQNNRRHVTARTLTRGEVRGGGKKPWRQKGTGRARVGSSRNPIWRGGGVVFGPRAVENFSHKVNQSAKKTALAQALTLAAKANRVNVIDTFECKEGKVASTAALLKKMELENTSVLLVVSQHDDLVRRATRNLAKLRATSAQAVSVSDVLDAEQIIISKKSLDVLGARVGKGDKT